MLRPTSFKAFQTSWLWMYCKSNRLTNTMGFSWMFLRKNHKHLVFHSNWTVVVSIWFSKTLRDPRLLAHKAPQPGAVEQNPGGKDGKAARAEALTSKQYTEERRWEDLVRFFEEFFSFRHSWASETCPMGFYRRSIQKTSMKEQHAWSIASKGGHLDVYLRVKHAEMAGGESKFQ